ncbi:MAG: ATP-dependent helicase [Candidatus Pacebacteria bacterium]|nr:ATP-dependent helicase [Candidatus Paceibacterota bacterium]
MPRKNENLPPTPTKKPQTIFDKEYTKLNLEQKRAVDTIEGPVMVIAGPGTGKTQVLALRIAQILKKTDTVPRNILALTFTESAVKAMRDRLLSIIGADAYYVNISTFHAFCSDIIQSNPEYFPFSRDAEPLSDLERFTIIEDILRSQSFEAIKPINSPLFYVKDCLWSIQNMKREGVNEDALRILIEKDRQRSQNEDLKETEKKKHERVYAKQLELLQVYILYQQKLKEMNRYDFEDMISSTVEAFTHDPVLLQSYQERFQYVLVDEFQDTNNAQLNVLHALTSYWGDEANIFVVGDSDQSLYRFQGASIENSLAFMKKNPNATYITLENSYRSAQSILDAAHHLIRKNGLTNTTLASSSKKLKINPSPLRTQTKHANTPIHVVSCSSDPLETIYVAEEVQKLIKKGVEPSEIAVLYKNNADSLALEDAFTKWGIPYEVGGGADILDSPIVHQLLVLFQVICDVRTNHEDLDLFTLLNYEWVNLNALDILKIARQAALKKTSMFSILHQDHFGGIELEDGKKIVSFIENIVRWSQLDAQTTFPQWFETVMNESGFLSWTLHNESVVDAMNAVQSLFSEVKNVAKHHHALNLQSFLDTIKTMREHHIAITEEDIHIRTNAVKLSTAHSAKGMEWEYVFIIRALDGKWGNVRTKDLITLPEGMIKFTKLEKKEENEDERRLFYVALTRAKKQVVVSYAQTTIVGNKSKENTRTMFIEEIPENLRQDIENKPLESQTVASLQRLMKTPEHKVPRIEEDDWLRGLLEDFTLTPTAMNTYLACAYKFKLNVLVKVPRAKQDYLAFGTAVHKALEMVYRKIIETGDVPQKEYMVNQFETALKKEVLTPEEELTRLHQGRKVLSAYYDEYKDQLGKPVFLEKFLGYGWSRVYVDDVRIGGRIDKIEWIDPKKKSVAVVDYKTGQPKTRNEIEGKTANSTGDYKRQLLFYKLLADLDQTFALKVERGIFDFVEQDKQTKKFRREEFSLNKEEVDELRTIIKDVMKEIRALHFPKTDNYALCKQCEFHHHCWPNGIPQQVVEQMKLL